MPRGEIKNHDLRFSCFRKPRTPDTYWSSCLNGTADFSLKLAIILSVSGTADSFFSKALRLSLQTEATPHMASIRKTWPVAEGGNPALQLHPPGAPRGQVRTARVQADGARRPAKQTHRMGATWGGGFVTLRDVRPQPPKTHVNQPRASTPDDEEQPNATTTKHKSREARLRSKKQESLRGTGPNQSEPPMPRARNRLFKMRRPTRGRREKQRPRPKPEGRHVLELLRPRREVRALAEGLHLLLHLAALALRGLLAKKRAQRQLT